jgi:type II secretory pathway component PulJ
MSFPKANKSGIFLLELLLSILLFAVASTVCIQIFATSHSLSDEAKRLDHSVSLAESIASCIQSGITTPEDLQKLYPQGTCSENSLTLYLDRTGTVLPDESESYCLFTVTFGNHNPVTADINMTQIADGRELFALRASVYEPCRLAEDTEVAP